MVLLVALFYGLFFPRPEKKELSLTPLTRPVETVAVPAPLEEAAKEPSPAFSIEPEVESSIKLTGIMYAPDHPLAVINDGIWSENEYIGKLRIAQIGKDSVKFEKDGAEFTLKLKR